MNILVIKLHFDEFRFNTEVKGLKLLSEYYYFKNIPYYALGYSANSVYEEFLNVSPFKISGTGKIDYESQNTKSGETSAITEMFNELQLSSGTSGLNIWSCSGELKLYDVAKAAGEIHQLEQLL